MNNFNMDALLSYNCMCMYVCVEINFDNAQSLKGLRVHMFLFSLQLSFSIWVFCIPMGIELQENLCAYPKPSSVHTMQLVAGGSDTVMVFIDLTTIVFSLTFTN